MPEDRSIGNRTIAPRSIGSTAVIPAPTRYPLERSSIATRGLTSNQPYTTVSQDYINNINQKINSNVGSYLRSNGNQQTATTPTIPQGTFYGTADPLAILSDVFRNALGSDGSGSYPTQTGQALVPVTSTTGSSGGSLILILLVIALAVGGYYLYKKYNG